MGQRIGIFGGSFNPIHIGHLVIAEAAWQEFGLEKVIFVPTGDTPHKDMHHIPKETRYRMVELAVENNPHFAISDIEVRRTGISYTVDTIREFQKSFPGETEFYFIAGTDAVAALPSWKYNRHLLELCHFICARRPGNERNIKETIRYFGDLGHEKIHCLMTPELAVSSTILRHRIELGKSVRYLIPDPVIDLIEQEGIYRR